MLDSGIIIVTLVDGKVYDNDTLDEMDLLISLLVMSRAHEESRTKGDRVQGAWDNKRKNSHLYKITKWSPKWLDISEDKKSFTVIKKRAALIRQIYKWSSQGHGAILIIRKIEAKNIQPWDMGTKIINEKRRPKRWHVSYIQRLLTNRAVLGEFTYTIKGEKFTDKKYFPQIIQDKLFYSVQALRSERNVRKTGKGAGRKGKHYTNIFSGVAYCGYSIKDNISKHECGGDNENMIHVNKGRNLQYLKCSRLINGNGGCNSCRRTWRYDRFETSFLTHITDIDASILIGTKQQHEQELDSLLEQKNREKGKILHDQKVIQSITNTIHEHTVIPKTLLDIINQSEINLSRSEEQLIFLQAKIDDIQTNSKNINVASTQLKQSIDEMHSLTGDKLFDHRLMLSMLIKRYVTKIEVFASGNIFDEEYFNKFGQTNGSEAEKTVREAQAQIPKTRNCQSFFLVFFKSGATRLVIPNPNDPNELIASLKWDTETMLEENIPIFNIHKENGEDSFMKYLKDKGI